MKQLVILSGKGGTGKSSVAASFVHLASLSSESNKPVIVDADVDASNLGILLDPDIQESHDFTGGLLAEIDENSCTNCGLCEQACRFDAIIPPMEAENDFRETYTVDPIACEGCTACMYACPVNAISMQEKTDGEWYRSNTRQGQLFHANLFPAADNSGKLVTLIRQQAQSNALDTDTDLIIIDGPPGIGCPVIAAATGVDYVLIVTEPTIAGIHDLNRAMEVTHHFNLPTFVVINKADLNPQVAQDIKQLCADKDIHCFGTIPFDTAVTEAMQQMLPVTAYKPKSPASLALVKIWQQIKPYLES